ncbi:MAG: sulfotransferase [Pseudomonadota bacterium]
MVTMTPAISSLHPLSPLHVDQIPAPDHRASARDVADVVNFLVLGVQKGGTTWICDMLRQHPDVFIPTWKELRFFNRDANFQKGYAWYLDLFRGYGGAKAVGEGNPTYFFHRCDVPGKDLWNHPDAPARIREALPGSKLILSFRDPVKRAVSAYQHFLTRGQLTPYKPFRDVWDEYGIRAQGEYANQLELWLELFPAEQFHMIVFEDDIAPDAAKQATLDGLFDTLGVDRLTEIPGLYDRSNEAQAPALAHFNNFGAFRDNALGRKLRDGINRRLPKSIQDRLKIRIPDADLDALREHYQPHNARLEALMDRSLPW